MQLKHTPMGTCHLELYATDLAVFALAFREASNSNDLMCLNPIMTTTLDSLAATFERAALVSLQQEGKVPPLQSATMDSEDIQVWCAEVVQHGAIQPRKGIPTNAHGEDSL
jgi:hypothetical protein